MIMRTKIGKAFILPILRTFVDGATVVFKVCITIFRPTCQGLVKVLVIKKSSFPENSQ